jgi:hypothetical protein
MIRSSLPTDEALSFYIGKLGFRLSRTASSRNRRSAGWSSSLEAGARALSWRSPGLSRSHRQPDRRAFLFTTPMTS